MRIKTELHTLFCVTMRHSLRCVKTGCCVGYVDNNADATDNCKWNTSTL